MLKISLNGKDICYIPTSGLDFYQLGWIREVVAEKEGVGVYELDVSHERGA